MMGQPIQKRSGQFGVTEHITPFRKAQVGGDDHAGSFVQFAEQVKQQCTAILAERQIAQFIQNNQIGMGKSVGQPALITVELFLFQRIYEFNGRQEPYPPVMMHDRFHTDGGSDVSLAGAGTANQYDILGLIQECTAVQGSDQCFVDRTVVEYEAGQVTMGRKTCDLHLVVDGSDLTIGNFRLYQLVQQIGGLVVGRCALFGKLC